MNESMSSTIFSTPVRVFTAALAMWLAAFAARGDATNQTKSLTLRECVERALENNLEIKSQRINPTIGTWGVIGAQGVYDPLLAGSVNYQDAKIPEDPGFPALKEQTLQPTIGLSGKLPTGATYDFSANETRLSGNVVTNFAFLYTGQAGVSATQPLLKNFGFGVNAATIRIARENKTIAVQNFVQFVMSKISAVSTAYYELIFSIENHKTAVENRELAQELLDQNRKREQVGTMSPLDVIQAEAGVAESEQNVILTARAIKDNENTLKRLICQQVTEFRGVSLVPVDQPMVQMVALDVEESTRTALQMRADYLSALHALESQNINVQFNRNQLWPQVDLAGSYGFNGRGHTSESFNDNVGSGDNPVWGVGVVASFPLGNRQARSNYHISKLDA